jgi:uncharacterized protein YjbJ (UPF0337 family)
MTDNRISGAARKAKGALKQAAGKATGSRRLQVEGAVDKVLGDAQNKLGKAQGKLGKAASKLR